MTELVSFEEKKLDLLLSTNVLRSELMLKAWVMWKFLTFKMNLKDFLSINGL